MDNALVNIVKQIRDAHDNQLINRWAEMPIGSSLCVHEGYETDSSNQFKMYYRVETHFLEAGEECTTLSPTGYSRNKYGPKGE
jgi:hypothetical protein